MRPHNHAAGTVLGPGRRWPACVARRLLVAVCLGLGATGARAADPAGPERGGDGAAPSGGHGPITDLAIVIGGGLAALAIQRFARIPGGGAGRSTPSPENDARQLRDILDHLPCYVGMLDTDGTMIWCNDPPLRDLGLTLEDVAGRPFWDAPWWSHDPAARGAIREAILAASSGEMAPFDTTIAQAGGPPRPVDFRVARVLDDSGRIRFLVPASVDLTERKRAEDALRASDRRLRTIFENSTDPMSINDAERRILEVNPRACDVLGYTRDELLGLRIDDLDAGLNPAGLANVHGEVTAVAPETLTFETRIRRKDGSTYPAEVRTVAIDWEGQTCVLATTRDLTERNRASASLRASEQRLRTLFEELADPLFVSDEQGRFLEVNPRACESLGRSREELLGMGIKEIDAQLPWDEIAVMMAESIRDPGRPHTFETRHRRADGTSFPIEIRAIPLEWDGQVRYLSLARDLSARKEAERALRESEQKLRLFVEHAPAALAMFDREMRYVVASRRWCEDFALVGREFVGRSHDDIMPEIPDHWREAHRRGLAGEIVRNEADRLPEAYGHDRWNRWEVRPWHAGGSISGIVIFAEDITEQQRASRAIAESEARYRSLFEANPHPMWVYDLETLAFLAVNDAAVAHYGYPRDEFLAMTIADIRPDEDVPRLLENLRHSRDRTGMDLAGIWRHRRRDGSLIDVEITSHRMGYAGRDAELVLAHDVTERLRAEAALRASEERFRTVVDRAIDPLFITDLEGRFLDTNQTACEVLGYTRDELLQMRVTDVDAERVDNHLEPLLADVLEQSGATVTFETRHRRKDGTLLPVELRVGAVRLGDATRLVGVARDLTERKRIEAEIRSLNADLERRVAARTAELAKLVNIVDASTDLIAIARPDGETDWANRAMEQVVGRHGPDGIRVRIADSHPPDSARLILQEGLPSAARDGHWLGETEVVGRDGRIIPVSQLILAHRGAGGEVEYFSTIMRDITERKRMELELARASRLKDEFLASMSHELRTPLNGVLALSEALLEGVYGQLGEAQAEVLRDVARCGRHLLGLINEILDLSRIEAGHMELEPTPADLERLCRACLRMVQEDAQRKRLELRLAVRGVHAPVVVDERRVRQILLNLLSNAVKFTPEEGIITLEAAGDADRGELVLSVDDTGIGIAAGDLDQLFVPFRQLDARLSRQFEGTGLGLALVRKLARLHGGDVEVESEPGRGSRFTVRLPWVSSTQEADEDDADAEGEPGHAGDRPLLLLAEDNEVSARVARDYLRMHDFDVVLARDGREALKLASDLGPALIVMDIQLPEIDGLEVIRRLRAEPRWQGVPIVAMTALAMPGDRERCLLAGADEYVSKPIRLHDLEAIVRERLGKAPGS
ncbi:MAG: PAS domain S-box protein [Isosphaeraceae bacterium]